MADSPNQYVVEVPAGGWRVADTRVTLESVVRAFWEGHTPELIAMNFSALTLEQIYGAITFYFSHRELVDRYLQAQDVRWAELRDQCERQNQPLLSRLRSMRTHMTTEQRP